MSCLIECLSTGMVLGSFTSFLLLLNRILKAVSAFLTYWILQSSHSSKYMMKLYNHETMFPLGYYHNDFVATNALGHMM